MQCRILIQSYICPECRISSPPSAPAPAPPAAALPAVAPPAPSVAPLPVPAAPPAAAAAAAAPLPSPAPVPPAAVILHNVAFQHLYGVTPTEIGQIRSRCFASVTLLIVVLFTSDMFFLALELNKLLINSSTSMLHLYPLLMFCCSQMILVVPSVRMNCLPQILISLLFSFADVDTVCTRDVSLI